MEVNGLSVNDTTLPLYEQQHVSTLLISTNKATEQEEDHVPSKKSAGISPPWNALGAKPKTKSHASGMGGRVTGRSSQRSFQERWSFLK